MRDEPERPEQRNESVREDVQVPADAAPRCDLCGAPMREWHCRIICTSCGYQRDCSDP